MEEEKDEWLEFLWEEGNQVGFRLGGTSMNKEEYKKHCEEQIKKLPKGSRGYEEHLMSLNLIEAIEQLENKVKEVEELLENRVNDLKKEYKIALNENSIQAFILKCKIEALEETLNDMV